MTHAFRRLSMLRGTLDCKRVQLTFILIDAPRRSVILGKVQNYFNPRFTCFWYDIVPDIQQSRYDIVPRTELLSFFSSHD